MISNKSIAEVYAVSCADNGEDYKTAFDRKMEELEQEQVPIHYNVLPDTLTKEKFWNRLYHFHPERMKHFCAWIDDYKKRVRWNDLFWTPNSVNHRDIKFHDIPIAMQLGIFIQYASENKNIHPTYDPTDMSDFIRDIERFIADRPTSHL